MSENGVTLPAGIARVSILPGPHSHGAPVHDHSGLVAHTRPRVAIGVLPEPQDVAGRHGHAPDAIQARQLLGVRIHLKARQMRHCDTSVGGNECCDLIRPGARKLS